MTMTIQQQEQGKAQPSGARDTASSVHLDAVRAGAAILVAFNHLRVLFFTDYSHVAHKSAGVKLLYLLSGFGHDAVMVFFVLSGFFISNSVIRSFQTSRWTWGAYALNRLTRLYIVLLPALLLGLLWDGLGLHGGHAPVYQRGPAYLDVLSAPLSHLMSVPIWLGNLFFLQGIAVKTFGSNGPLWSLSYEFWYYVLFPLGLTAFWPSLPKPARVVSGVLALLVLLFVGEKIALYGLIWLMGVAAGVLKPTKWSRSGLFLAASWVFFGASLLYSRNHPGQNFTKFDFIIGIAFSALLYALLSRKSGPVPAGYARGAHFLAGLSYTLYLVHVPLLVFLNSRIIGERSLWQPDAVHCAWGVGIALLLFFYTCVVWRCAEANTDAVRRMLSRRLHMPQRLAAPKAESLETV